MNRAQSRNALSTDLISALHTALVHPDRDTSVRAVVVNGADPAFCAGLDLKQAQRDQRTLTGTEGASRGVLEGTWLTPAVPLSSRYQSTLPRR